MDNLAPISVSVYIRIEHLKKSIESLKKNTLAKQSILYIFSDGPKKGDEQAVKEMRKYLKSINGFKQIHIVEREVNNRVKNNRDAQKMLVEQYGKMICVEEDVVCAPGFLSFINKGLDYYKNNKKIFSISGYSIPVEMPADYKLDYYTNMYFNGWGFGIWKDRYEQIKDINIDDFKKMLKSKKMKHYVKNIASHDALYLFHLEAIKDLDALDVKIAYHEMKNDLFCVFPIKSLTNNIGCDGTGEHCAISNRFDVEPWNKLDFVFQENINLNKDIVKSMHNFNKTSFRNKMYYFLKRNNIL